MTETTGRGCATFAAEQRRRWEEYRERVEQARNEQCPKGTVFKGPIRITIAPNPFNGKIDCYALMRVRADYPNPPERYLVGPDDDTVYGLKMFLSPESRRHLHRYYMDHITECRALTVKQAKLLYYAKTGRCAIMDITIW